MRLGLLTYVLPERTIDTYRYRKGELLVMREFILIVKQPSKKPLLALPSSSSTETRDVVDALGHPLDHLRIDTARENVELWYYKGSIFYDELQKKFSENGEKPQRGPIHVEVSTSLQAKIPGQSNDLFLDISRKGPRDDLHDALADHIFVKQWLRRFEGSTLFRKAYDYIDPPHRYYNSRADQNEGEPKSVSDDVWSRAFAYTETHPNVMRLGDDVPEDFIVTPENRAVAGLYLEIATRVRDTLPSVLERCRTKARTAEATHFETEYCGLAHALEKFDTVPRHLEDIKLTSNLSQKEFQENIADWRRGFSSQRHEADDSIAGWERRLDEPASTSRAISNVKIYRGNIDGWKRHIDETASEHRAIESDNSAELGSDIPASPTTGPSTFGDKLPHAQQSRQFSIEASAAKSGQRSTPSFQRDIPNQKVRSGMPKTQEKSKRKLPQIVEQRKLTRTENAALAEFGTAAANEYMASRKPKSLKITYIEKKATKRVYALYERLPGRLKTQAFKIASTADSAYDAAAAAYRLAIQDRTPVNRGALALAIAAAQKYPDSEDRLRPLHAAFDPEAMDRENAALAEFGAAAADLYAATQHGSSTRKSDAVKNVTTLYKRLPRTLKTEADEKASTFDSAHDAVNAAYDDVMPDRADTDVKRGKLALAICVAQDRHGYDDLWPRLYRAFDSYDPSSRSQSKLGDNENAKRFPLQLERLQGVGRNLSIEFSKAKLNLFSPFLSENSKKKESRRIINRLDQFGNRELRKLGRAAALQQRAHDECPDSTNPEQAEDLMQAEQRTINDYKALPEMFKAQARRRASTPEKARKAVLTAYKRTMKYPAEVHRGQLVVAMFTANQMHKMDFDKELDLAGAFNPNNSASQSRQQYRDNSRGKHTLDRALPIRNESITMTSVTPKAPTRRVSSKAPHSAQLPASLPLTPYERRPHCLKTQHTPNLTLPSTQRTKNPQIKTR